MEADEDLQPLPLRDDEHKTYIGTSLEPNDRKSISTTLVDNVDLFAWTAVDMPGVSPDMITHCLSIFKEARSIFNLGTTTVVVLSNSSPKDQLTTNTQISSSINSAIKFLDGTTARTLSSFGNIAIFIPDTICKNGSSIEGNQGGCRESPASASNSDPLAGWPLFRFVSGVAVAGGTMSTGITSFPLRSTRSYRFSNSLSVDKG